jgi:hypothetical protein
MQYIYIYIYYTYNTRRYTGPRGARGPAMRGSTLLYMRRVTMMYYIYVIHTGTTIIYVTHTVPLLYM